MVLSIKKDGNLFIQERQIENDKLIARLKALANNNMNIRIFIKGDKNANYGKILDVIARVKSAGFKKAALVAKLKKK